MALFRQRPQQEEPPKFDWQSERQQLMLEMQSNMQAMLQPMMTAIQALGQRPPVQQQDEEGEEQDNQQQPKQQRGMTPEQVRQMMRDEQQSNGNNYVPKNRMQAMRALRNSLTEDGRAMFDKYGDEVEAVIDNVAPQLQGNPQAWEQAFRFAMINNHEQEYVKILLNDAKPEDLPPHLQPPVGQGGGTGEPPEAELSDDEKIIQPIFDRTTKGGFTPKQMREFGDLPFESLPLMIANAQAKGLIKNGTAPATTTNPGNNA